MDDSLATFLFHRDLIPKLPEKAKKSLLAALDGARLDVAFADVIAKAIKDWAIEKGATLFAYWFQPFASGSCSKKYADLKTFSGKDLLRFEMDEPKGYLVWDPTALPFLWGKKEGIVLCIPSLLFSEKGEALDYKIPLIRAEEKLNKKGVIGSVEIEQDYYLIDKKLFLSRPDLQFIGKALSGKTPERVMSPSFMRDLEKSAIKMGISLKLDSHKAVIGTGKASFAVDQNLLLVQLMRLQAAKHHLANLHARKSKKKIRYAFKIAKENSHILSAAILRASFEHKHLLESIDVEGETVTQTIGAYEHPGLAVTILYAAIADSLSLILDEIGDQKGKIVEGILEKHLQKSLQKHPESKQLRSFIERKTVSLFEDILSEQELEILYETELQRYVNNMHTEANLLAELFETKNPAITGEIKKLLSQTADLGWEAKAKVFQELIEPKMEELR